MPASGPTHSFTLPTPMFAVRQDSADSLLRAPRNVAVIMDGNGRWAKARLRPRAEGHRQGVKALHRLVERAAELGVEVLTVFAFSSENWKRPATEVRLLMELFAQGLARWEAPLREAGVRLTVIGDRSAFPESVVRAIEACERGTAGGERMLLQIAANYGGRWDVCQAARRCAEAGEEVSPENLEKYLATAGTGEVDLLIRTGGEQRVSNFLLWQMAYAEIYFTETLWPDFNEASFDEAVRWYQGRERRFGMTSEQVRAASGLPGL